MIHDRIHSRMYHKTSNFGNLARRHRNLSEQSKIYFIYCGLTNLHWKIFFTNGKFVACLICTLLKLSVLCVTYQPHVHALILCLLSTKLLVPLLQKKLWTSLPYVSADAIHVNQPKGLTVSHNVDFWWKFIFGSIDSEPFSSSPISNSNFSSLLIHSHCKCKNFLREMKPGQMAAWWLISRFPSSYHILWNFLPKVLNFTAIVNYSKQGIAQVSLCLCCQSIVRVTSTTPILRSPWKGSAALAKFQSYNI